MQQETPSFRPLKPARPRPGALRLRPLLLGALALLAASAGPAAAADKVVMGWLPATDALPFYVAMEEKAFEAQGIEVADVKFQNPNQLVDAFIANKAEIGPYGTAPGIALIAESQFPDSIKLFGLSGGKLGTPYVNSTLLVKKGSEIRSLADVRGHKLGIIPGIQWRTMSRYVLRSNGMNPDADLKLVELAFPLQIQALTVGTVDALIAIEPLASMAIATGEIEPILLNVGATYVSNPFFGGAAVMTTTFIKERPDVARRVMLVLRDITNKINADFDRYRPLMAKYSGVPEKALPGIRKLLFRNEAEVDDSDLDALQKFTNVLSKEGVIAAPMDVRTKFIRLSDLK